MVVTFLTLLIIGALTARKQKGAVLIGILVGAVIYYVLGFTVPGFYDGFGANFSFNPFTAFGDFAAISFGKVFTEGFDFSGYLAAGHTTTDLVILFITTALAFCLVDMFDTLGTLYGACHRGNLLDKEGNIPNMEKAMLADAIATCTGAICGTSTVTTFVESSAGVAEGGRTGLASMVTAGLFFIAMFLSPVASLIPGCATAAALIYVGILMINCVRSIEWTDTAQALPAFMTLAVMPFSYNISYGIAFGVLSSVLLKVFTGKVKDVKIGSWVIAVLFVIMFVFTH
jgi:AGZA family xanthine/uracil permease-like MFS transporter